MNMNKILAAGLVAAVSSTAFAGCGDGGFYVGLNAGIDFTKAKVTKEAKDYTGTANDTVYYGDVKFNTAADAGDAEKAILVKTANARSKAFTEGMKKNNKKTKFLAELVLGYDFRINDVMMGVELLAGGTFGKTKLKTNMAAAENAWEEKETKFSYGNVKEQWHFALMPRVGYLFTPEFEGYVTFGVKFARWKVEAADIAEIGVASTVKAITPTFKKKSSMRVTPVVGAGVRYEFTPELFAKLEYNFEFATKVKLHKEAMPELKRVKTSGHAVKLGLGYRF